MAGIQAGMHEPTPLSLSTIHCSFLDGDTNAAMSAGVIIIGPLSPARLRKDKAEGLCMHDMH